MRKQNHDPYKEHACDGSSVQKQKCVLGANIAKGSQLPCRRRNRECAMGTPLLLSWLSQAGAYSPRESENNIRVERYRFVFALESAAVIPLDS